jgi:hypothetical protein
MQEQFVPYEIALKLKQKGFDEPCFATYNHEQKLNGLPLYDMENNPTNALEYTWINSKVHDSICCAPLWQQVIDWLREKHSIDILIDPAGIANMYSVFVKNWIYENEKDRAMFTYPEARQAAIEYALTLI